MIDSFSKKCFDGMWSNLAPLNLNKLKQGGLKKYKNIMRKRNILKRNVCKKGKEISRKRLKNWQQCPAKCCIISQTL